MKRKFFFSTCNDEKEGSFPKQDQLFKFEIPLGLTIPEAGAGSQEVLWRQAVPATSLATLLGGLGVLALATPAAYIAFQSGQSGENPLSLTKVSVHISMFLLKPYTNHFIYFLFYIFRDITRAW